MSRTWFGVADGGKAGPRCPRGFGLNLLVAPVLKKGDTGTGICGGLGLGVCGQLTNEEGPVVIVGVKDWK